MLLLIHVDVAPHQPQNSEAVHSPHDWRVAQKSSQVKPRTRSPRPEPKATPVLTLSKESVLVVDEYEARRTVPTLDHASLVNVMLKPVLGMGPSTAPSPQQRPQRHWKAPVPDWLFHSASLRSSLRTILVLPPAKPVDVAYSCMLPRTVFGLPMVVTKYTSPAAS